MDSSFAQPLRVAVIGGGISGLASAYLLAHPNQKQKYHVTLYERHASVGMDSSSVTIDLRNKNKDNSSPNVDDSDQIFRVDVPLRVVATSYYSHLASLYKEAGVHFETTDYSSSFRILDEVKSFFQYSNYRIGPISLPVVSLRHLSVSFRVARDYFRFLLRANNDLKQRKNFAGKTVEQYLAEGKYSSQFVDLFFLPVLAAMLTCSYGACLRYPAEIIAEYIALRAFRGTKRAAKGSQEIVKLLTQNIHQIRLSARISCVKHISSDNDEEKTFKDVSKIQIVEEDGTAETYDAIIVATQANQAIRILQGAMTEEQRAALSQFSYETSEVVVHTDAGLMPTEKSDWSSVNMALVSEPASSSRASMPEATIWLNCAQASLRHIRTPVFQSWAPLKEPRADSIICRAKFERPIIDFAAGEGMRLLDKAQGQNGLYFAGSYALWGMPLLENGVRSGLMVAKRLGAELPWPEDSNSGGYDHCPHNESRRSSINSLESPSFAMDETKKRSSFKALVFAAAASALLATAAFAYFNPEKMSSITTIINSRIGRMSN